MITGEGDAFCAGWDLEDAAELGEGLPDWDEFKASVFNTPASALHPRVDVFKPVIAAVNGWAVAALENALLADIRIPRRTRLRRPGARWNIVGGDGMTVSCPRGRLRAGDGVDHHRPARRRRGGARIGLANEVVPREGAGAGPRAGAPDRRAASGAIRSDKERWSGTSATYEEQLRQEAENTLSMFARKDSHAIGARAFKEAAPRSGRITASRPGK